MAVRNAVREYREQRELSLRELAQRAEVDPTLLSRVERQLGAVGDDAKVRLAQALDVTVGELFFPDFTEPWLDSVEKQSTSEPEAALV